MIFRSDRTNDVRPSELTSRDDEENAISPARLAAYWGVHVDTIYRDIRKGALKAFRVGPRGQWRIRRADARRYGRPNE